MSTEIKPQMVICGNSQPVIALNYFYITGKVPGAVTAGDLFYKSTLIKINIFKFFTVLVKYPEFPGKNVNSPILTHPLSLPIPPITLIFIDYCGF